MDPSGWVPWLRLPFTGSLSLLRLVATFPSLTFHMIWGDGSDAQMVKTVEQFFLLFFSSFAKRGLKILWRVLSIFANIELTPRVDSSAVSIFRVDCCYIFSWISWLIKNLCELANLYLAFVCFVRFDTLQRSKFCLVLINYTDRTFGSFYELW